ncbi:TonB-dependent receptor plug domain-containing protein [Novosphingobium tardum]|uniref:TonB-dependent receptor plug domain-containing protein n=1 Tax=Novosphingobium tardum TaxID=1538021 RepID=A0ABV8RLX1_9SPHN
MPTTTNSQALTLTAVLAVAIAPAARAEESAAPLPVATPGPASPQVASAAIGSVASTAGRQVYQAADFARYAPRNAFDMLRQVPGFSIRDSEQMRGLGQATGNVLVNGQRLSSKSDDIYTQLSRIPASNVTRIEIVDGATLDIPGLSGEVANLVVKADAFSGQFSWQPQARAHFTDPLLTRGAVSVSGTRGPVDYEVGLTNSDSGRSGAGGLTIIRNGAGEVIERRNDIWTSKYDSPKLSARLAIAGPGKAKGNVNAHYQRIYSHYDENGIRVSSGLPDRSRFVSERNDTYNYEFGGDYAFPLGPGQLKLIGLDRFSHEPYRQTVITRFADGRVPEGDRYAQVGDIGEKIARGEYSWKMLGGEWQVSGEAAFNTLDNVAALFALDPASGDFVGLPFPGGSGGVKEDRYEGLLSFGRPLSRTLSFQLVAGAERSTISQTGANGLTRTFFRPKGSVSLAWKPSSTFDLSAKLRRRVLQLSFYDFLARAFLDDDNQNAGNNQLVPQQDWSVEIEANKKLGPWGSTKLRLIHRSVEDYVDIVPIGATGESVGNIPKARAHAIDWTSTVQFDPLGWKGAKLDAHVILQKSSLRDPFTGQSRPYSGFTNRIVELSFRRDIPGSPWAYGAEADYNHQQASFRRNQTDRIWEGPVFGSIFVENKNVLGLTMRADLRNIGNARSRRERVVYGGLRGASPIAFTESRDRLIGPIIAFSVKGGF